MRHAIQRFEKKSDFIVFVVGYDGADPDYQQAGFTVLDAKILNVKNSFLLSCDQRETIQEIILQRLSDFRPNRDRKILLSPAIPYECIYKKRNLKIF